MDGWNKKASEGHTTCTFYPGFYLGACIFKLRLTDLSSSQNLPFLMLLVLLDTSYGVLTVAFFLHKTINDDSDDNHRWDKEMGEDDWNNSQSWSKKVSGGYSLHFSSTPQFQEDHCNVSTTTGT